jgi:hypothetical protein
MKKERMDYFSFHRETSCLYRVFKEIGKHIASIYSTSIIRLLCTDNYQIHVTNAGKHSNTFSKKIRKSSALGLY